MLGYFIIYIVSINNINNLEEVIVKVILNDSKVEKSYQRKDLSVIHIVFRKSTIVIFVKIIELFEFWSDSANNRSILWTRKYVEVE